MPSTASEAAPFPAEAGNKRCRLAGIAKKRTIAANATAAHIDVRCPGKFSDICTLRGPETEELGACTTGAAEPALACEEAPRAGSLIHASNSSSNSPAFW